MGKKKKQKLEELDPILKMGKKKIKRPDQVEGTESAKGHGAAHLEEKDEGDQLEQELAPEDSASSAEDEHELDDAPASSDEDSADQPQMGGNANEKPQHKINFNAFQKMFRSQKQEELGATASIAYSEELAAYLKSLGLEAIQPTSVAVSPVEHY